VKKSQKKVEGKIHASDLNKVKKRNGCADNRGPRQALAIKERETYESKGNPDTGKKRGTDTPISGYSIGLFT